MIRKVLTAGVPLLLVILVPVLMRRTGAGDNPDADQLVIISPHNETIRSEFEIAFGAYYQRKFGREVDIDWRTPGGTSEIVRYIKSEYTAAFRHWWEADGRPWTAELQRAVLDHRLSQDDASPTAWEARQAFLASRVGIGVDLFFGGGQYDCGRMAAQGILVASGVRGQLPELFTGELPILSQSMSGEIWYDPSDRYYGACLSSFGICYNSDRLRDLGLGDGQQPAPRQWADLGHPHFFGEIGLADPSKSGSINKCFEMLIQQQMAQTVTALTGVPDSGGNRKPGVDDTSVAEARRRAVAQGWDDAMLLIRKISANARYFTASASKVAVDVALGDAVAGMCIDFYGRTQCERERRQAGRDVMAYVTPVGGSSISCDPIGMLRGAPQPERAREFICFVLSKQGQRLWNYRPGTEGGPERYALRRLPIRRDVYTDADRARMSDGDARPFELATRFTYHPEWTASLFGLIRLFIRVMAIDCHDELRTSWQAIIRAGGPERVPAAMEAFRQLPFPYEEAPNAARQIRDARKRLELTREWAAFFRQRYAEAGRLSRAARGEQS